MHIKKIASFALGPVGAALLGFITLPLVTWFFSQEDVGRLAMLNVAISFSVLLYTMGLDQAYIREFHQSSNTPALLKTTILPGLILLVISLTLLSGFNNTLSKLLFDINSLTLSIMVSVVILSSFIARFLSLILRMNEQGLAYSMSQLLPKILLLVIISASVFFSIDKNLTTLIWANLISALSVCCIYAWNTRREWLLAFNQNINYRYLKSLLRFGLPLIFGGLAYWGLTVADRIFIKELVGFEQLGLYSVSVSFAAAAAIFQSVFSTLWAPTVYKWEAEGGDFENVHKVTRYVLLFVITLFCLVGLLSWLVTWILPQKYYDVRWIVISCLGCPLLYTLSETTVIGIGITRRSEFSMIASVIAFLSNLIGNYYLVPVFGAAGAAVSTCISFWIFLILRTEFSVLLWRSIPRLMLYLYTVAVVLGASFSTLYGKYYTLESNIFWLAVILTLPLSFKKELSEIKDFTLNKIKSKY